MEGFLEAAEGHGRRRWCSGGYLPWKDTEAKAAILGGEFSDPTKNKRAKTRAKAFYSFRFRLEMIRVCSLDVGI